ncbi:bZIP transcription factor 60-like isoform X2 [Durio zibethinus]|uniref:BZIP transcription factor 60-like isoform X2 n=1 Tax=Durio zibethinus TaxID=66656 RepID=A0A6P5Z6W3_DURZI|nr:bZIP transcription factor 60-like isoform X2 [Durio zibethinus]
MEEINRDSLLLEVDFPDLGNILEKEPESVTQSPPQPLSTQNPDEEPVVSSWIGEIEKVLMEDDHFDDGVETQPVSYEFLADLLVDSPPSGSGEAIDDAAFNKQNQIHIKIDNDDPTAKKQMRQLRNRDASARSRERKKMYVKDLEIKSRYLEGEYRRLNRMLQCFIAENQALRLTLHKGCAFDASSAKQESAVGFPALVPGHHVPVHPANAAQVSSGGSSAGKRGKERSRKSGSKRGRE